MDYYDILGIPRNASKEEIKRAYRKLAHKYHPDKKDGDEQKFKHVNEAYHVLIDDEKRGQYDRFGRTFEGGAQNGGFDFSQSGKGFAGFDFSDIFEDFLGFGARTGAGRRVLRGRDISIDLELSLSDAVFGTERRVLLTKIAVCSECMGEGGEPEAGFEKCAACAGSGTVREAHRSFLGTFTQLRACNACGGQGRRPRKICKTCAGKGVARKTEEAVITIPHGIQDGEMIRLAGAGEAVAKGTPGDLYVKVHVRKHPTIRREGNDLCATLSILLSDALLGAEKIVETLDGQMKVKVPAGTGAGELLRVRGKGVPSAHGRRGDFLIRVALKTPKRLSQTARRLIEDLRKEGL